MHCPRRLQNSKTPKLSGAETTDAGLRTLSWNSLRQLVSVSTNGAVVVRYAYDAWGNVLTEDCAVPALAANRYRFQGREYSAATGLVNFRARWYGPETGRWLSKDPIGLAGGLNLYVFCGNEPMEGIDPLGLSDATIGESGAYTYKKFPGDAHFGGDHVHVYDRKTGAFLGRLDMTGHVISGSVPKKGIARFLKLLKGGIFKAGRCAVKCVQVVFCAIPLTLELILEPTPCNADEDIILEMIRLQAIQAEASLDVNDNAQDMETDVLHTPLLIIR